MFLCSYIQNPFLSYWGLWLYISFTFFRLLLLTIFFVESLSLSVLFLCLLFIYLFIYLFLDIHSLGKFNSIVATSNYIKCSLKQWFSTFLSHGTHFTNYWNFSAQQKIYILPIWQKIGVNFDSFTSMAIILLSVVLFLFDNLREKTSRSPSK